MTNLKELEKNFTDWALQTFVGDEAYNAAEFNATANTKKVEQGLGSITIDVIINKENGRHISTTIYMSENNKGLTSVMYVNNYSHSIIYRKFGKDVVDAAVEYAKSYIKRVIQLNLGLPVEPLEKKD